MNPRRQPPPHRAVSRAYRQAFERLDAALEKNTRSDNSEMIQRMRQAYFADVDAYQKSGKVIIPK